MNNLSLFTGSGIGDLAAREAGIETIAQCENDPCCLYCLEKLWPDAYRFKDVRDVTRDALQRLGLLPVDIISGGFPCTDISCAGKGAGIHGKQSGLWFEMFRVIDEVRPRWVLAENVPLLRVRGADRVLSDLEGIGYACRPVVVGAWAVGAPHKRDRVWIVGRLEVPGSSRTGDQPRETDGQGRAPLLRQGNGPTGPDGIDTASRDGELADPKILRRAGQRDDGWRHAGKSSEGLADADHPQSGAGIRQVTPTEQRRDRPAIDGVATVGQPAGERRQGIRHKHAGTLAATTALLRETRWPARPGQPQHEWEAPRIVECGLGCTTDGFSDRVRRRANKSLLRILGNAWVPQVANLIYQWIKDQETMTESHYNP